MVGCGGATGVDVTQGLRGHVADGGSIPPASTNDEGDRVLVVKIELWPGGDESRARLLTLGHIYNDGSHEDHPRRGNYEVRLNGQRSNWNGLWRTGRVDNFPRLSYGPWELLRRALDAALKETG